MKKKTKINNVLLLIVTFCFNAILSQDNPVSWAIVSNDSMLIYNAQIGKDWHLYAAYMPNPNDGPLPTLFEYTSSENYLLKDSTIQENPITHFDDDFGVEVSYYEDNALFKQKIKITTENRFLINGKISYMCCNDVTCIPLENEFEIVINPD